jgi:hypothetical protein
MGNGDLGFGPIPKSQTPIPKPQSPLFFKIKNVYTKKYFNILIIK